MPRAASPLLLLRGSWFGPGLSARPPAQGACRQWTFGVQGRWSGERGGEPRFYGAGRRTRGSRTRDTPRKASSPGLEPSRGGPRRGCRGEARPGQRRGSGCSGGCRLGRAAGFDLLEDRRESPLGIPERISEDDGERRKQEDAVVQVVNVGTALVKIQTGDPVGHDEEDH